MYVSRQYLKEAISRCQDEPFTKDTVYAITELMPSADVVEVVRCKDCKYRAKGLPYCAYFGETDFCSYGERKETK